VALASKSTRPATKILSVWQTAPKIKPAKGSFLTTLFVTRKPELVYKGATACVLDIDSYLASFGQARQFVEICGTQSRL
jgi:hypothetical protein